MNAPCRAQISTYLSPRNWLINRIYELQNALKMNRIPSPATFFFSLLYLWFSVVKSIAVWWARDKKERKRAGQSTETAMWPKKELFDNKIEDNKILKRHHLLTSDQLTQTARYSLLTYDRDNNKKKSTTTTSIQFTSRFLWLHFTSWFCSCVDLNCRRIQQKGWMKQQRRATTPKKSNNKTIRQKCNSKRF